MYALDFEYDGILASDYEIMICSFDAGGVNTVNCGSQIKFNSIPLFNGTKYALTSTMYEDGTEYTFQICKSNCYQTASPFSVEEQRRIFRWLNRNDGYHVLKICQEGYENINFRGSFNIQSIQINGNVYGFELTFITDSPFADFDLERYVINATSENYEYSFDDYSDNIGYIYPDIKIVCNASGDLKIHNSIEDRTTIIKNCTNGEIITCDKYLNIATSLSSHKIYNDFNFTFFRIANKFNEIKNTLTFSIPCTVIIEYNPTVKGVGI